MNKENFLTVRWNNILTLVLGIPALIYILYALSGSLWTSKGGLIVLSIIGVVYWLGIEFHTAMRFAWLHEKSGSNEITKQAYSHPLSLIRLVYNAVFWIFLIPFLTRIDFKVGFISFAVVISVRLVLNLYTNNVLDLSPEKYENYPFRIPWFIEEFTLRVYKKTRSRETRRSRSKVHVISSRQTSWFGCSYGATVMQIGWKGWNLWT